MRLVDADILIKALNNGLENLDEFPEDLAIVMKGMAEAEIKHISMLPTIDAEPVRRGEWECMFINLKHELGVFECSSCGWHTAGQRALLPKYCPNCGAKMEYAYD